MNDTDKRYPAVEKSVADLKHEVSLMANYDEKHLKWSFGIKVVLAIFIAGYMGFIYVNLKPVDAKFLVFIAQDRITEALPQAKKDMTAHLTKMAPGVVDQVGNEIMANLPTLGKKAEGHAKQALTKINDQVEADLSAWLSAFIIEKKDLIDEMFPDMSSYEQITAMRKYIIEDGSEALKGVGDEVGLNLKDHDFTRQLRHLAYGTDLTPKEQLQREVIALMYVLVQKNLDSL